VSPVPLGRLVPGVRLTHGLNRTKKERRHEQYRSDFHAGTTPRQRYRGLIRSNGQTHRDINNELLDSLM
jgi:hypothetical protein